MRVRHVILPALAAGLLTACATTGEQASSPPPAGPAAQPATMYAPRITADEAYVRKVEALARIRGVDVRWVNKPVKREVDQ